MVQKTPPTAASFAVKRWPLDIWHGEQRKAERVVRQFREELVAAGALVRIGRELVVIAGKYETWLGRHGDAVESLDVAAIRRRMLAQ